MIRAVIFDCFGVLTASTYDRFYATYLAEKPEVVTQIKALDHASNKGSITMDDFYNGVAEVTGLPEAEVRHFMSQHQPNEELFEYIRTKLKPSYRIGFLSNVAANMMDELFTKKQQALFDDVVLSFAVGMAKPELEIFELAADRLGVATNECIFVDDVQTYVDAADVAGMDALLYTDFQSLRPKIEELL